MKTLSISAIAGAVLLFATGTVLADKRILDGDTISFSQQRYQLVGIDAPEVWQTCRRENGAIWKCGEVARNVLVGLTSGQQIKCYKHGVDQDGRFLGVCWSGNVNLNEAMVEHGVARRFDTSHQRGMKAPQGQHLTWFDDTQKPLLTKVTPRSKPYKCSPGGTLVDPGRFCPAPEEYNKNPKSDRQPKQWRAPQPEVREAKIETPVEPDTVIERSETTVVVAYKELIE